MRQYDNAMADVNRALSQCNEYSDAFVVKGKIYMVQSERFKAIEEFSRALEIDDTNAEAHGLRAWCCETVDLSDLSVVDDLRHKAEEDKQKMKSLRGKKKQ